MMAMPNRRRVSAMCLSCVVALWSVPASAQQTAGSESATATAAPSKTAADAVTETPKTGKAPGFRDLFTPIRDFKQMVRRPDAAVLGVGAVGAFMVRPFDGPSASNWNSGMSKVLGPGEIVGGAPMQSTAAVATYVVGRVIRKPRVAEVGADLVRAQMLTQMTTQLIKFSTQRTRPDGTSLSFPSGHTSSSFATATVLQQHFGWKAGVPAYAMATWVAASRVQKDRHFVSDVVAGATLGILAGKTVTVGRGQGRFSVSPMAAPGGLGVSFTHVGRK
jgi:membrane-associated phospholipid phosphatase